MRDNNLVNLMMMVFLSGLSREECKKLKAKRRTLKNRGYAASCRHKRDNEEGDLQGEKMELEVTTLYSSSLNDGIGSSFWIQWSWFRLHLTVRVSRMV